MHLQKSLFADFPVYSSTMRDSVAAGNSDTGIRALEFGGGTTTTTPLLDPSAGTGRDNPGGQTARVTITIKQP